jgi:NAD(P)H-hydrate epimerase
VSNAPLNAPAVTAAQMREVDRLAVEEYAVQLIQMMEHAGRALAEVARRMLGGTVAVRRIFVAAGRGNNGGGGLAAARNLANWGGHVTALIERADAMKGTTSQQLTTARAAGVGVIEGDAALETIARGGADLLVDALIGYGLNGPPRGWTAEVITLSATAGLRVLSLDVPSGLDASSGDPFAPCVQAAATLTLALPKTGLLAPAARAHVGTLYLADIGIPPRLYAEFGLNVEGIFEFGSIVLIRDDGMIDPRVTWQPNDLAIE